MHIAIIPDGNRRWARKRGLLPWKGHAEGLLRVEEVRDAAFEKGIAYCTVWVASADNLRKRSKIEIRFLVMLFRRRLANILKSRDFERFETRIKILGRGVEIMRDAKLAALVGEIEKETAHFSKTYFTILFGYDGREEMLEAIARCKVKEGRPSEAMLRKELWTGDLPDVDLVIRTGGEPHWSAGFMMWHTANSQFYFTEKLWPDFDPAALDRALAEYAQRERRLGK